MTILPTKRGNGNEESKENGSQNNSKERSSRLREEHNVPSDSGTSSARRSFSYTGTSTERKELQKRYKEPPIDSARERLERERQKQRELRRERKRERQAKRTSKAENSKEKNDSSTSVDSIDAGPSNTSSESKMCIDEDGSGCNSEDEYDSRRPLYLNTTVFPSDEEWARRDAYFSRCLLKLGYEIKKMHEDGACLFRAIADQVYGDQELHATVRTQCMDYIVKNQDFFAPYVTEDFDKYVERKRRWHVHGNHLEIQALSEMYNRTIEVYCYHTEPINIFNASSMNSYEPIRVSYHRMCHYNSITNPRKPSVLVGLGLPNYCTRCDLDHVHDAVRQSEELLIEQTMLEDKIKATDWEATNEALEEQVARESYIQFYRDVERRLKTESHSTAAAGSSSSTITSAMCSSPRSSRRGSVSPKGPMSPKGGLSPKTSYPGRASSPRLSNTALVEPNATLGTFEKPELVSYNQQMSTTGFSAEANMTTSYPAYGMDSQQSNESIAGGSVPLSSERSSESSITNDSNYQREDYQDWDETIMAQVLAESQLTYFDELKRKVKKRNGSPGPSTSQ